MQNKKIVYFAKGRKIAAVIHLKSGNRIGYGKTRLEAARDLQKQVRQTIYRGSVCV